MSKCLPAAGAAALAIGLMSFSANSVNAAVTVLGGELAKTCSIAAKQAAHGVLIYQDGIRDCTLAIQAEPLSSHDMAGTYVNRGILYLSQTDYNDAKRDFDFAAQLQPDIGEIYVNRGAALIGMRHYLEGRQDIDRGLALNPEEREKAYFNRALADEGLDDERSAYFDYTKATELKPDWDEPRKQLTRFTVSKVPPKS
jgi:tetratricopeptide (TPR) repeat protein